MRLRLTAHAAELQWQELLQTLPVAVYMTDPESWITFYNHAAENLSGAHGRRSARRGLMARSNCSDPMVRRFLIRTRRPHELCETGSRFWARSSSRNVPAGVGCI